VADVVLGGGGVVVVARVAQAVAAGGFEAQACAPAFVARVPCREEERGVVRVVVSVLVHIGVARRVVPVGAEEAGVGAVDGPVGVVVSEDAGSHPGFAVGRVPDPLVDAARAVCDRDYVVAPILDVVGADLGGGVRGGRPSRGLVAVAQDDRVDVGTAARAIQARGVMDEDFFGVGVDAAGARRGAGVVRGAGDGGSVEQRGTGYWESRWGARGVWGVWGGGEAGGTPQQGVEGGRWCQGRGGGTCVPGSLRSLDAPLERRGERLGAWP